jgi:hypothetical protein
MKHVVMIFRCPMHALCAFAGASIRVWFWPLLERNVMGLSRSALMTLSAGRAIEGVRPDNGTP